MTTISNKDRAEAQAMYEAFNDGFLAPNLSDNGWRRWLAVRDHVLASHECPSTDRRALGYYRHPSINGQTECPECGYLMHEHGWLDCGGDGIVVCPSQNGPFGGQSVTDHARNHTCPTVPVWRPTTADEIQPGWMIRSRDEKNVEATWGIAHHQDRDGDWRTKLGAVLTYDVVGWTYETTTPLPEPEPDQWPEGLVVVLTEVISSEPGTFEDEARAALDALAARGYLDRAAIAGAILPAETIVSQTQQREGTR